MKRIIRKSEIYSIEKVEERIAFYTNKLETTKTPDTDNKLLLFWENYKLKNFNDAKTGS